jgi:hypothetical protein
MVGYDHGCKKRSIKLGEPKTVLDAGLTFALLANGRRFNKLLTKYSTFHPHTYKLKTYKLVLTTPKQTKITENEWPQMRHRSFDVVNWDPR